MKRDVLRAESSPSARDATPLEPWCVEVSTVSTVSTECRGSLEGVSVDTGVEVSRVSRECRR